ncbi:MAG TPA: ABC transporter ATP-binding protein, partial [bacterium]|nr:ABC transporter ATP-binding protein [bacterium]
MKEAFEINGLKLSRDGRRVLDIEHAAIPEGRVTVIVGPNGCGKTTLLECLNGLQRPDEGEVLYFGGALNTEAARGMTLVSQRTYLFDGTVGWNVSYGLRARGRRDCGDAVASALHAVRLDGFENRNAEKLSGGEAKRVAVARARVRAAAEVDAG